MAQSRPSCYPAHLHVTLIRTMALTWIAQQAFGFTLSCAGNWVTSIGTKMQLKAIRSQLSKQEARQAKLYAEINNHVSQLSKTISHIPKSRVITPRNGIAHPNQLTATQEIIDLLNPVQREINEPIIVSNIISASNNFNEDELSHYLWHELRDVTPVRLAQPRYDRARVPVIFSYESFLFVGWHGKQTVEHMLGIQLNVDPASWVPRRKTITATAKASEKKNANKVSKTKAKNKFNKLKYVCPACQGKFPKHPEFLSHVKSCPKIGPGQKHVLCKHCATVLQSKNEKKHLKRCPKAPTPMPLIRQPTVSRAKTFRPRCLYQGFVSFIQKLWQKLVTWL